MYITPLPYIAVHLYISTFICPPVHLYTHKILSIHQYLIESFSSHLITVRAVCAWLPGNTRFWAFL